MNFWEKTELISYNSLWLNIVTGEITKDCSTFDKFIHLEEDMEHKPI